MQVQIHPDDLIVLVSDGIVDAQDVTGELFGFERLEQVLHRHQAPHDPARLIREIMDATDSFTGDGAQHDDMTVVAFYLDPQSQHHAFTGQIAANPPPA